MVRNNDGCGPAILTVVSTVLAGVPAILSGVLVGLSISGCASPGLPRAPSLNLPKPIADLAAQRRGSHIHLEWTTPDRTTDGLLLSPSGKTPATITVEICRGLPGPTKACSVVAKVPATPGQSENFDDTLPLDQMEGAARLMEYRIRALNAAGRSAAAASVLAPVGKAPLAMAHLVFSLKRQGAELTWTPEGRSTVDKLDGGEQIVLERSLVADSSTQARRRSDRGKQIPGAAPARRSETELRLPSGQDPGGAVDSAIEYGKQYVYNVARERTVALDGHTYLVQGGSATVVTPVLDGHFPPYAPGGLASIATPATAVQKAAIDLSWEPSSDPDVATYNIYRSESFEGSPVRINRQPQPGTSWHDDTVQTGRTYRYTVTAVNRRGDEGPGSKAVDDRLP